MDARALQVQDASGFDLDVVCSGTGIDDALVDLAKRKIRAAARGAPGPVLFGRIKIKHERHRSIERPFVAAVSLDVDGHVVRAQAAGFDARESVDLVEERLRRQLVDARQRILFLRRRDTGVATPGEWRHDDRPTERREFLPRAPEEREVIRRKAFPLGRCAPEDAVVEMEMLDHSFYLFVDSGTGDDAVVRRSSDGAYELSRAATGGDRADDGGMFSIGPTPPTLTLEAAVQRANGSDEPFLFFVDAATSRGAVLYRRSDGHYGLVEPEPD